MNGVWNWFKKKGRASEKENIFIHIPKVGGSTFVGLLKESISSRDVERDVPTHLTERVGRTRIVHIDLESQSRKFKQPDLFEIANIPRYKESAKIFCLVRNPVDRVISEFNFQYHILEGKTGNPKAAIYQKLKNKPQNVVDYARNKEVRNYQVKFLLGRGIGDTSNITEKEFQSLVKSMSELPVIFGITEEYDRFLNLFTFHTGIKLNSNVLVRKKTPILYEPFLDDDERSKILDWNHWDQRLYEFAVDRIRSTRNTGNKQFKYQNSNSFIS